MVGGKQRSTGTPTSNVKLHGRLADIWASFLELRRAKPYARKPKEVIISLPLRAAGRPLLGPLLTFHWAWGPDDHPASGRKGATGWAGVEDRKG